MPEGIEFVIDDTNPNVRVVKLNDRRTLAAGDVVSVTTQGETANYTIRDGKTGNERIDILITEE